MDKQPTKPLNSSSINIKVTEPVLDPTKSFVTYLINGNDSLGTFEIRRRYNDFFHFRECLRKRWPGLYIPPIPEKKINISGQDDQQIQYRRKFFDYFLKRLATFPHLFACSITQQFLRNQTIVIQKYYQTMSVPQIKELITQYKQNFPSLHYKQTLNDNKNCCNNFSSFLKKAEKQLKILTEQLGVIVEARNAFIENLNACNTSLLPEYEKNIYAEYISDAKRDPYLLFIHDHKIQDSIRNLRDNSIAKPNPFAHFYDMLIFEYREIEAFQEVIQSKQEKQSYKKKLEQKLQDSQSEISKLMGGKITFKSIFGKGSKNDQIQILQKQIPQIQKQIELLGQFCEILNCIQATVEIPNFKQVKKQQYYENLNLTSERQMDYLNAYGQFKKSVIDGLNKIMETK